MRRQSQRHALIRHLFLVVGCLWAVMPAPAGAQPSFAPVTISVQPATPTTSDHVVIRPDLTFNTGGSDARFVTPNDIVIDVFVRGPDPRDPVT
jgi:hypothetical protein